MTKKIKSTAPQEPARERFTPESFDQARWPLATLVPPTGEAYIIGGSGPATQRRQMAEPKYGTFEMEPVRFNDTEAWWFFMDRWKTMPVAEIRMLAGVLNKTTYDEMFGELPPLPPEAFAAKP